MQITCLQLNFSIKHCNYITFGDVIAKYFTLALIRNTDEQLRLRGEIKVPVHLAKWKCGYKYVLLDQKNKRTYEELVEFRECGVGVMDRCLVIDLEYAAENSKSWEKFNAMYFLRFCVIQLAMQKLIR